MVDMVLFRGGPWDGEKIPVERWMELQSEFIEREVEELCDPMGSEAAGRRIWHDYRLSYDPDGQPVYVHRDEQEA